MGAGDEMFADSYPMREIEDGFFFEVDGSVSIFLLAPTLRLQDLHHLVAVQRVLCATFGAVCTSLLAALCRRAYGWPL